MTPVNSTSLRASTSNQWLVSSGSAHHAPPYRSSSLSEPCSWPRLLLEAGFFISAGKQIPFGWLSLPHFANYPKEISRVFTCMFRRPLWGAKPWWDWEEANSWSSSTRWDSMPRGGHSGGGGSTTKYHLSFKLGRSNTDGFGIKEILCLSNQWILCVRVCVLVCVFSSYSLVQWAPTSASISPLPLPPTASSVARLQSVDEKTTCVKTCSRMHREPATSNIPICACVRPQHPFPFLCLSRCGIRPRFNIFFC